MEKYFDQLLPLKYFSRALKQADRPTINPQVARAKQILIAALWHQYKRPDINAVVRFLKALSWNPEGITEREYNLLLVESVTSLNFGSGALKLSTNNKIHTNE